MFHQMIAGGVFRNCLSRRLIIELNDATESLQNTQWDVSKLEQNSICISVFEALYALKSNDAW